MSRYWCFVILILCFFTSRIISQGKDLRINEFMASNVLTLADNTGEYEDWIEIYNSGDTPADLAGYYITNDPARINIWKIPAGQPERTTIAPHGYIILWADKAMDRGAEHTGFKLSKDKGEISLLDKDGRTVLDNVIYKQQFRDVSTGRYPDGAGQYCYSEVNTPGKSNKTGYAGYCFPVIVDQQSGFYSTSVTAAVQAGRAGDIVRYTLDGSDPTESSPLYTGPVAINATSVFKARAFKSGEMPGVVTSSTYFINKTHSLPVMTMIIDPKNLYDPATGIYVNDKDGREWERYSELEYFTDRTLIFHSPAGQRIQGNTGPKDFEKKSFRSYFREGYGQDKIRNVFYPYDTLKSFSRLVLRAGYDDSMLPAAGGADTKSTLLRDPLITEFWRQAGELTSHSRFAVLYLNEKYHGIYDIKESIDENFIKDHLGYSDLDMMRTRYDSTELVYGTRDTWIKLVKFFENNTFESEAMYLEAAKMMDLDNFIDLQVLVHGAQYSNWSYGTFMYREKSDNSKFRWNIWDADKAYTDVNYNLYTTQLSPIGTWLDNLITKKLFKNKEFRNRFQNRLCDLLNTVFDPANALKIIDSLAQHISPEIPNEVARWTNSEAKWKENVELMRNFARQRAGIVFNQTKNYFQLGGISDVKLEVNTGSGKVIINSVVPKSYPWTGKYFTGVPVSIKAVPDAGYIFVGWTDSSLPQKEEMTLSLDGPRTLSAIFAKAGNAYAEVIAPKRIKAGMNFPYIVRLRSSNWSIEPLDQTPFQISFAGAHADTLIKMKRGAGTGLSKIDYAQPFIFTVQNGNTSAVIRQTTVSDIPSINYSGTLPAGVMTWDGSADRVITSDLTIPAGCTLNVKAGTWIIVKKYVNFYIQGRLTVEGTADDPVVITSENMAQPWGGMEFANTKTDFRYCIVINGGGDASKGHPTNEDWHTGHQHIFFGKNDSEFNFDQCFFLNSQGKVFGAQDSKVTVTNSVSSFVWLGGEFHRVLLNYKKSHLMNMPNDDNIFTEDIDTDGFHIDYVNPKYPEYSVIDSCYFITGKDDAIDHHFSRLKISNCWLEGFVHEGVAASGGDTVKIFNTVALNNDQGFEAGWTENGVSKGPYVFIDHCAAVNNNVGLRIGDSYNWTYKDYMNVTNSVVYGNKDNIWNYLNSTKAPLAGALDITYSMINDSDYDNSPFCITGVPQFDGNYYLMPGSPGTGKGMNGTDMGRIKVSSGTSVKDKEEKGDLSFALEQNYPNPFNPVTNIRYTLSEPGDAEIILFNSLGQKAAEVMGSMFQTAGSYKISFDGRGMPSGIYFYRLVFVNGAGKYYSETKKMIMIK